LDNIGSNSAEKANTVREKQMQVVLARAALTEYPTYIAGDFNSRSDGAAYSITAEQYRDCQVYAPVTDYGTTAHSWGGKTDDADTPIDYCFVNGEHFVTHTFDICRDRYTYGGNSNCYLSDHYALMTEVSMLIPHVHTELVDDAVAVTCTTDGLTEGKHCSTCGEVLVAQEVISAPGHTEVVDAAKNADCITDGLTEGKHCSVCGEVLVAQTVVEKLGHKYDDDQDTDCNTCGATRVPGCNHENKVAVGEAKDATCTEDGSAAGEKCADCGEVFVPQVTIPATGHTEVTDEAVAPTCTETGLTEGKHCSVCDEVLAAQETVDALDHDYTREPTITDPTISEAGSITYECARDDCSETKVITLPALNTTDYTTVTTGNGRTSPVVATTTFTYNNTEVEYTTTLTSNNYVSVDLGNGNGSVFYSQYEIDKLCNADMTVTYDPTNGYTFHANTPCTLTHISVYGHNLTMTGNWNIEPSQAIVIHDGNLYIGTDEKSANVIITAVGNFGSSYIIFLGTGEDLTIAKESTLKLQSETTGGSLKRLLGADNNVSNDYSKIDIYGTLITEAMDIDYDIFMKQYHRLNVYEGGTAQCGIVYMGKNHQVNVSGEMKVSGSYTQKQNSVLTISQTGSVQVVGDVTAESSTLKVNGGKLTVGGKIAACNTFTVTGSSAEVVITGTSAKKPTVSDGATVTINGVTY